MAAELGFEPRHTESESAVLPLHNSAILYLLRGAHSFFVLVYFSTQKRVCQVLFSIFSQKMIFYTILGAGKPILRKENTPLTSVRLTLDNCRIINTVAIYSIKFIFVLIIILKNRVCKICTKSRTGCCAICKNFPSYTFLILTY